MQIVKLKRILGIGREREVIIPIATSFSIFTVNMILKEHLDPSVYGEFAVRLFFIICIFMVGGLGVEQVLTRLSKTKQNKLIIDIKIIHLSLVTLLLSPLFSYLVFTKLELIDEYNISVLFLTAIIPVACSLSVLYKLTSNIGAHYIALGGWKVVLLTVVVISVSNGSYFDEYVVVLLGISLSILYCIKKYGFPSVECERGVGSYSKILMFFVAGFFSVISFLLFDASDRFAIKAIYEAELFGDYFFIYTMYVTPVGILTNYISSKKLPEYKKGFTEKVLVRDYIFSLVLSINMVFLISFLIIASKVAGLSFLSEGSSEMMLSAGCLAIIRGGYSILSMGYTVVCSSKMLAVTGGVFGFIASIVFSMVGYFDNSSPLSLIVAFFVLLWFGRSLVYWKLIIAENS